MSPRDDLTDLIGRHADGIATADDYARLEAALAADADLRWGFLAYMDLDAALASGDLLAPVTAAAWPRHRALARRIAVTALAIVAIAAVVRFAVPPAADAAALLVATSDARWSDPNVELLLRSGELPEADIDLAAGAAEFRSARGATICVRGPATFRFDGAAELFCRRGELACFCPTRASRLVVRTADAEVVDLGTVFAIQVPGEGATRVSVLEGEVELRGDRSRRLTRGQTAVVRSRSVLRIEPLGANAAADIAASLGRTPPGGADATNLLQDPGFDRPRSDSPWRGTQGHLEWLGGGTDPGRGVRVSARGHRFYPLVKQSVPVADIAGRIVSAAARARPAADAPLHGSQYAAIKIAFTDAEGREFACASRRMVPGDRPSAAADELAISAVAPAGTHGVQLQLVLHAAGLPAGAVIFEDARLCVAPANTWPEPGAAAGPPRPAPEHVPPPESPRNTTP